MIEIDNTTCCGINEISDISDESNTPEGIIKYITIVADKKAHFNFSDVVKRKNKPVKSTGEALAKYIRKHNLGKVIGTPPAKNTNTGNLIRQWTWTPDYPNLNNWKKTTGKKIKKLEERKRIWEKEEQKMNKTHIHEKNCKKC